LNDLAAPVRPAPVQASFRVLVIDDDPDMAAFLERLLTTRGMEVDHAADGKTGLARVATSQPDLLLLDVMLPDMSGFEICARLKGDPSTALVPIVLITALEDHASRVRGIEAGADDFLSKPVRREELMARVQTLRRLHETRKELENRRLAAEIQRKEAIRTAFSRYISPRLAERIIADAGEGGQLFSSAAQRTSVVALFADLRGFTRLTEQTEVGQLVKMLNEYFTVLTETAYQYDATIFNMAGDSLLIGFNVPFTQEDAAERAYRASMEMLTRFAPIATRWEAGHGLSTGVGIGICMGDAVLANVGSPHYTNYTIIGNPVNMAARLMQMAAPNEVLVCGEVYARIRALVPSDAVEPRGDVQLRGRSQSIPVYSVKSRPER
jgi:adenylate cyclase